ncbi:MAG: biotin--[acetyl-CoA-carboxylase] ligase [Thermodesulfobacteriota bacterium]|nr:biotin--[acetyl-CoA-carboxylase] ligase [Thermodesulfobacteriota bacterium]
METDKLVTREDRLDLDILRNKLSGSLFGINVVFHEKLDSTNTLTKDLAAGGAPEGTLVLAEEQTAGRGRMGRPWLSPRYANLLFSVLLRPHLKADQVFILTMTFALAASDGVEAVSGLKPMIKWPNDLYLGPKKLGGLLTEFSVKGKSADYVVLGLGLNVNWHPSDRESILYPATSIREETNKKISREELLTGILVQFEDSYRDVTLRMSDQFYKKWNERSMLFKKKVEIETVDGRICGEALRINRNGALIISKDNGEEQRILNGDVSVKL